MTARITPAEARKLGIDVPPARRTRTTRKEAVDSPYHTRCRTCGVEFKGHGALAAEDRHLHDTHHARYDWIDG